MLIGPTTPTAAFELGAKINDPDHDVPERHLHHRREPGRPAGACRFPAASSRGLPVGLQLIGAALRRGAKLLNVAHRYQQRDRLAPARARGVSREAAQLTRRLGNRHRAGDPRAAGHAARRSSPARPRPTAPAQHAGQPGRPRLPGRAAGAERRGGAHGGAVRPGDRRRRSRRARCSRARTTSTPTCPRATRSASTSCRSSPAATSTSCSRTAARKRIGITRAHLEEDAGKSLHEGLRGRHRHRPEPRRHAAARDRLRARHALGEGSRRLHEEGAHAGALPRASATATCRKARSAATPTCRCAARGAEKFGTRAEIKNLNSFRFVEKAINYEVARQIELLEGGGKVVQETRLYDPDRDETRSMRSKEEANDYRYFPDPDLLPVVLDEAYIDAVRGDAAGAAGPEGRALRSAVRPVRLRRQRADREPRAGRLLRGRGARAAAASPSSRPTGSMGELAALLNRDGLEIARQPRQRRARSRGCCSASPTTRSPARSPRKCSRRCGPRAATPTRSSRRGACKQITDDRRHREGHRRGDGRESRRSWPTTAPARTSCSASSSARS